MCMYVYTYMWYTIYTLYGKSWGHNSVSNFSIMPQIPLQFFPFHICNSFLWQRETWFYLSFLVCWLISSTPLLQPTFRCGCCSTPCETASSRLWSHASKVCPQHGPLSHPAQVGPSSWATTSPHLPGYGRLPSCDLPNTFGTEVLLCSREKRGRIERVAYRPKKNTKQTTQNKNKKNPKNTL